MPILPTYRSLVNDAFVILIEIRGIILQIPSYSDFSVQLDLRRSISGIPAVFREHISVNVVGVLQNRCPGDKIDSQYFLGVWCVSFFQQLYVKQNRGYLFTPFRLPEHLFLSLGG